MFGPAGNVVFDESYQVARFGLVAILEVETSICVLDVQTLGLHIVLQDQLLEEQKGPLVLHSLTNLHLANPKMWRKLLFAFVALQVLDYKFHHNGFFKHGVSHYFPLNSQFNLESTSVRLRPHEARIHQFELFVQSFDLLEAMTKKGCRL